MRMTLWPMPKSSGDRVDAYTVDVVQYEIASEHNHPTHLHQFGVAGDKVGAVQLWLNDGWHTTKLWLDRDMAQSLLVELHKAIEEAADFDPDRHEGEDAQEPE